MEFIISNFWKDFCVEKRWLAQASACHRFPIHFLSSGQRMKPGAFQSALRLARGIVNFGRKKLWESPLPASSIRTQSSVDDEDRAGDPFAVTRGEVNRQTGHVLGFSKSTQGERLRDEPIVFHSPLL